MVKLNFIVEALGQGSLRAQAIFIQETKKCGATPASAQHRTHTATFSAAGLALHLGMGIFLGANHSYSQAYFSLEE